MPMSEEPVRALSLIELQDASLTAITTLRDEIQQLFLTTEHDAFSQTVYGLVRLMGERGKAVLMLTTWSMPWDAEIILRSFYETSAKVLFLTLSPKERRDELVLEFWTDFDSIHSVRRARKAGYVLEIPGNSQVERDVFAALQNPNTFDLSPRHNKAKRKAIEQRWSFSEIVEAIARLETAGENIRYIRAALHIYGMASHLVHGDKSALEMVQDRVPRPEPERSIIAAAQSARIFSDLVNLWFFCADAISRALDVRFRDPSAVKAAVGRVNNLGQPFAHMFNASQEAFYAKLPGRRDGRRSAEDPAPQAAEP